MPKERIPGKPSTRRYTPAEREQAVRLVRQLRRSSGPTKEPSPGWPNSSAMASSPSGPGSTRPTSTAGCGPGRPPRMPARIKELEQEVKELRRANEILKQGLGVFRPGGARPPTAVMVSFIDEHRGDFGVEPICTALQVAPSTYYAAKSRQPSPRALRDAVLKQILFVLWSTNRKVYGAHKLWLAASRAGHEIGRDQVARLMRELGIRGRVPVPQEGVHHQIRSRRRPTA